MSMKFLVNEQPGANATSVCHIEDSSDIFKIGFGSRSDLANFHRAISDAVDNDREIVVHFEDDEPNADSETLSAKECFDAYQFYVEYVSSLIKNVHGNVSVETVKWSYPHWIFAMKRQEWSDSIIETIEEMYEASEKESSHA